MPTDKIDPALLQTFRTQTGQSIEALSIAQPVLLVFLRHFGCTFCREAVDDLSKLRPKIEALGTQLAFVHLSDDDQKSQKFFAPHGLTEIPRISDPDGKLFQAFGLVRAHWRQFFNYESVLRTLQAWLQGHWIGVPGGDVQRMPGAFLIKNGAIAKAYRHKLVSDRPDYLQLANPA